MKFLISPEEDEGWVAVKGGLDCTGLVERLQRADILVTDLDDTLAPSPAKAIAKHNLKRSKHFLNPSYWAWCFKSAAKLFSEGKGAESMLWKDYLERFLHEPEEVAYLQKRYTAEFAAQTAYPYTDLFFHSLPLDMVKVCVTRNIREVGEAYQKALGIDRVVSEAFDKELAIEDLVEVEYAEWTRYILMGDSEEDERMLVRLKEMEKAGLVDEVTSIYVASSPSNLNPHFDVNIGRDYFGLAMLLQNA